MAIINFTDSANQEWQVIEVRRGGSNAMAVTPGRESGWLSFTRDGERRRFAPVPSDWESFDAGTLAVLCDRAEPIDVERTRHLLDRRVAPRGDAADRRSHEPATAESHVDAEPAPQHVELPPDVSAWVSEHARAARAGTQTVVAALMELRQFLGEHEILPSSAEFRVARRQFLEAYYFSP